MQLVMKKSYNWLDDVELKKKKIFMSNKFILLVNKIWEEAQVI